MKTEQSKCNEWYPTVVYDISRGSHLSVRSGKEMARDTANTRPLFWNEELQRLYGTVQPGHSTTKPRQEGKHQYQELLKKDDFQQ